MSPPLLVRANSIARTAQAYSDYEACDSAENLETLRVLYEAVPAHLRIYCGDMDTRDTLIREALGLDVGLYDDDDPDSAS